jgi:hypothetical protein
MNPLEQLKSVLCGPDGKCCITGSDEDRAIVDRALQALAQPSDSVEQEPVGVIQHLDELNEQWTKHRPIGTKLYTTPPKRQPLTDDQIKKLADNCTPETETGSLNYEKFARDIEAAHDIKGSS